MENNEVIQLLQHHRHDLMNHMQIIQGYLSLGNLDKVNEKMDQVIGYFNEERKLLNLNAPNFAMWVMRSNLLYHNVRLTYKIEAENKNLLYLDDALVSQCEKMMELLVLYGADSELYEITLKIVALTNQIEVTFFINGQIADVEIAEKVLEKQTNLVRLARVDHGILCKFTL